MISKLRAWIFGEKEAIEEEEIAEDEPQEKILGSSSIFSTDTAFLKRKNINIPDLIQPKFVDFTLPDGNTFTFDQALESYGMDSTALKQTFSAAQSNIPTDLYNWYALQSFIGYQACSIISQHWLINKCLSIPAKDAVRNGYEISSDDGEEIPVEILSALRKLDKRFKINKNLINFETNKRRFGFRIALFVVESSDPKYYEKPFNIDGVLPGAYKGITQVDPIWMSPILDKQAAANPASMDFYEPTYWQINGKLYHKSHIVIARYVEVPDVLKPTYQYGGLPLPQLILERVYAAERTANEAPMLLETKRLLVLNVDLASIESNPEGFEARIEQLVNYRNNYSVWIAGLEDKIDQQDTSLTDLYETIMGQYELVASISEIPSTKLLGTSPKGFNTSGDYEQDTYHDLLENIQTDLTMILDRHHELCIKSYIMPKFDVASFKVDAIWNPVSSPNAKEAAEINKLKADADSTLQATGAIDGYDIRNRIINDQKSGYNGAESFEREEMEEEKEDDNDNNDNNGNNDDSNEADGEKSE